MALLAIAPYAVWMALMFILPASALSYAARSLATLAVFAALAFHARKSLAAAFRMPSFSDVAAGVLVGFAVFVLWVVPEDIEAYRRFCVIGGAAATGPSPYDPAVCGWPLTLARLAGSAFVIAPAEELFFRFFLYRRLQGNDWTNVDRRGFDLSAFLWTVGLFALEHDRIVAGAAAGAIYLFLYMRRGLAAAIAAHVVTNFALALYVIKTGLWNFW